MAEIRRSVLHWATIAAQFLRIWQKQKIMKLLNCTILLLLLACSTYANKESLDLIGTWKIVQIDLTKTNGDMTAEAKQQFIKETVANSRITFKSDKTYETTNVEGTESGTYRTDEGGKTLYFEKKETKAKSSGQVFKHSEKEVDTAKVISQTSKTLKVKLTTSEGAEATIGFERVK
jgi:hypothetical protein